MRPGRVVGVIGHRSPRLGPWAGLLLLAFVLVGCQSQPILDPLAVALDREAPARRRVRAVQATPDTQANDLMPLVVSVRHPMDVRRAALEHMLRADADAFWRSAATRIRGINDWPMLTLLCERAAEDRRLDFTPALIQSWARPSTRHTDEERPERQAIARLYPGKDVAALLWPTFLEAGDNRQGQRVAQAAWTILARTEPQDALRQRIAAETPAHELHRMLLRAADALHELPRDREALLRLRTVATSSTDADWASRRAIKAVFEPSGDGPGVALRHLPAIDHVSADTIDGTRLVPFSAVADRLSRARRVPRDAGVGASSTTPTPDTLSAHADALGAADLLVLGMLLDALAEPTVVSSLFEQADRDRLDTSTELGGVLMWDTDSAIVAEPFDPLVRRRDEEYIATDACVRAMHTGLAHYHFHAQRYDNADFAGPGGGDLAFADRLHANCVVFTFIDRNTLNADAYFPGGVVIDLGCIHR